jgi:hypothetical protein
VRAAAVTVHRQMCSGFVARQTTLIPQRSLRQPSFARFLADFAVSTVNKLANYAWHLDKNG